MAERHHHTVQLLEWQTDGSLRDGVKYLSKGHDEDTFSKAKELLEKALKTCGPAGHRKTKADPIGSAAVWAILLAQQAYALQHGWVAEVPAHWNVHTMHELLRIRQAQFVSMEGGSSRRDTRAVRAKMSSRAVQVAPPPHTTLSSHPSDSQPPCMQMAHRSSDGTHNMGPLRVDGLGDDDALKAKV